MTSSCLHKHIFYFKNKLTKLALNFTNGFKLGKQPCKCDDAKIIVLSEFINILCNYKTFITSNFGEENLTFGFSLKINVITSENYKLRIFLSNGSVITLDINTSIYNTESSILNLIKSHLEGLGFNVIIINNILYAYTNNVLFTNASAIGINPSNKEVMTISDFSSTPEDYLDKINCISYKELCQLIIYMKQNYKEC